MFMTPFAVFFLRQFFLGISREIEEAALLDGAGQGAGLLPAHPADGVGADHTLAILTYITAWNDYFWPLHGQLQRRAPRVLTVALGVFKRRPRRPARTGPA